MVIDVHALDREDQAERAAAALLRELGDVFPDQLPAIYAGIVLMVVVAGAVDERALREIVAQARSLTSGA